VKIALRTLIVGSFLAALLAAGALRYPTFADDADTVWRLDDYQSGIRAADDGCRELDRRVETVILRNTMKQEAIRDLLDGKMTFVEAVYRFTQINRNQSQTEAYCRLYPGRTDEQRAARQLIQYLRALGEQQGMDLANAWDFLLFDRGLSVFVTDTAAISAVSPVRSQYRGLSESSARRD
jgi:hypothetical protein